MQTTCAGYDELGPCGQVLTVRSLDPALHYCPEHTPKRIVTYIPRGLYNRLLTRLRGRPLAGAVAEALTRFLEEDS